LTLYKTSQDDSGAGDLPDVELNDFERSFRVWRLARAFDWKFPPDVLLRQEEALMEDLLTIEMLYRRIDQQGDLPDSDGMTLLGKQD